MNYWSLNMNDLILNWHPICGASSLPIPIRLCQYASVFLRSTMSPSDEPFVRSILNPFLSGTPLWV